MLELWDYLVQFLATAYGFCAALREYYRARRRPWFLLTFFYAIVALGTLYWTLHLLLRQETPQVFYVSDLAWLASFVFLLALMLTLPTAEERRPLLLFCLAGMGMCLLAAYLNTFFAQLYAADALNAAAQIAPVVEEIMKLLPLLFYLAVFEPDAERFRLAAIVVAASFATFENVCYLTQNGAGQFVYLLIRGFGTGAMHIVCGSVYGRVLRPVWGSRPLRAACLFGLLCVAIIYHAIYNLLVSVGGTAQLLAYAISLLTALCFHLLGQQTAAQKQ